MKKISLFCLIVICFSVVIFSSCASGSNLFSSYKVYHHSSGSGYLVGTLNSSNTEIGMYFVFAIDDGAIEEYGSVDATLHNKKLAENLCYSNSTFMFDHYYSTDNGQLIVNFSSNIAYLVFYADNHADNPSEDILDYLQICKV